MSDPQIIVIRDLNDYNDDPIAVYVDGKKTDVKVLGWWSDDSNEDNLLTNHWWVTCYGKGEDRECTDEGEYRLPDQWSETEWAALVAADTSRLPALEAGHE